MRKVFLLPNDIKKGAIMAEKDEKERLKQLSERVQNLRRYL
jgi:hypothetical protein